MFGIPKPPLKNWERADKLNVELVGYGWGEKRVIVRFHLPKDRDTERIQQATALMIRDVKHSKDWTCEWCGAPARESHVQNLSWNHLNPPRLVIYVRPLPLISASRSCGTQRHIPLLQIHFVCDMDARHVREGVKVTHDYMNMLNFGGMGPLPPFPKRPAGVTYPLAGSCARCERDESATNQDALKRCSKCKLTRYCGVECQKNDWPRHKVACGMVCSVNFENWD
ncbi:hypothetical protein BV20DRAFT_1000672 [Pilatotrama ljubarskyi]|nr:hypothetical protein BV20DRAFT_1000672 [Pilatotrama ljubarskyi]